MNTNDTDCAARGLYNYFGTCWKCKYDYSLADALLFRCPFCGEKVLPGDFTPERGKEILAELRARREALRKAGLLDV